MKKQASLNEMDLVQVTISASANLLENAPKDVASKLESIKGVSDVNVTGSDTISFVYRTSENMDTKPKRLIADVLDDVAVVTEEKTLRSGETKETQKRAYSPSSINTSSSYLFNLQYDYLKTDGVDISNVLDKANDTLDAFRLYSKRTGNEEQGFNQYVSVTAKSAEQAEQRLGSALTNTEIFHSGRARSVDVGSAFSKYRGKDMQGDTVSSDPQTFMAYAKQAHQSYLKKMQEFLANGVQELGSLGTVLTGDTTEQPADQTKPMSDEVRTQLEEVKDQAKTNVKADIEKIFDKALNNLALASWTKFRAKRLENATEAAMTRAEKAAKTWAAKQMSTGDSENPVDYTESPAYQRILEQKQEFDRQPTAEETLNVLKQVREQYQDAKKAGTDKDFKIQNTDTKDYADTVKVIDYPAELDSVLTAIESSLGVASNRAVQLQEPVKEAVSAYLTSLDPEKTDTQIQDLQKQLDKKDLTDKHTLEEIETQLKESMGEDIPASFFEQELELGTGVSGGKYPPFLEKPFNQYDTKEEEDAARQKFQQQMMALKSVLDANFAVPSHTDAAEDRTGKLEQTKPLTTAEAKQLQRKLQTEFNNLTLENAVNNYNRWLAYAFGLEDKSPKEEKTKEEPFTFTPTFEQFASLINMPDLKVDSVDDTTKQSALKSARALLSDVVQSMDDIRRGARTYSALRAAGDEYADEAARLVKQYNTLKYGIKELTQAEEEDPDTIMDVIGKLEEEAELFPDIINQKTFDYMVGKIRRVYRIVKNKYKNNPEALDEAENRLMALWDDLEERMDQTPEQKESVPEQQDAVVNNYETEPARADEAKDSVGYGELHTQKED